MKEGETPTHQYCDLCGVCSCPYICVSFFSLFVFSFIFFICIICQLSKPKLRVEIEQFCFYEDSAKVTKGETI